MRKFIRSASIILSTLLIFQFVFLDMGYALKENTKNIAATKVVAKSSTKDKVKLSPKGKTRTLVALGETVTDATSPTVPQNLSYKALSQNSIELNWSTSTDDSNNISYEVYRDDSRIATVTSSAIYLDSGLLPNTTYKYQVTAFDSSNNHSARSEVLTAVTKQLESTDTSIKVQMHNANRSGANNTISPWYKIYNTGTEPISLADIKIRYYYTINGEQVQNFWCDWSAVGGSNITGTFVKMSEKKKDADSYLEIGFSSAAGTIKPGESVELQNRFAKPDWANYDQLDDYSFNSTDTTYIDWNKATAYIAGQLKWGIEPGTEAPADTIPPTVPLNLTSYSISDSEIGLTWAASTDATGVSGYIIYRNGEEIAKVSAGTAYSDTGVLPETKYTYEVAAYDYANNISGKSQAVNVKAGENINIAIKLQMYNTNRSAANNTIYPHYKVYNTGNVSISLADIKIRYYYTINGEQVQNFWCDWSDVGGSNITGTFVKMPEKEKGADTYLEVGFKNEAGTLEPGESVELQNRFAKPDWANYDQSDDYSFDSTDTGYVDWNKATAYISSELKWGIEPGTETPSDNTPPTVPLNLSSYSISDSEVGLTWTKATDDTGVSGYIVYRNGIEITRVGEGISYTDKGLSPATLYTYQVAAYDYANNVSEKSQAVSTKTGENIATAIKLQLYNANRADPNNTIFPWYKIYNSGNVPINLENVKLRYYYTINGEEKQNFWCDWSSIGSSNVIGNFIKMPVVVEGVDYCLEISFKSGAGVLDPGKSAELQCRIGKNSWTNYKQSDDYSFNAAASYTDWNKVTGYVNGELVWGTEPITAPENIKTTAQSKSITLNWDAVPCASTYELEVDGSPILVDNGANTTYTHIDLTPGTKHVYLVRAKNQIMISPWSPKLTVITLLDKPLNIIKEVTETKISLSWDKVEGAISYDLEINGSIINNGTENTYKMEQLGAGTFHTVRIRAKGADIDGEWTDLMQIWTLPDIPTNIHTTSLSTSITLAWDKVTGASSYEVEVFDTPVDIGNITSYTHTGLEPNTQRKYRVRAKNLSGVSVWSNVVAATTLPGSSLNVQVQAADNSLKITWEAQAGASAYEIEIDGLQIIKLSQNSYLHTDLITNSEHTYRVRSKNTDGVSSWSQPVKGVVLPFVPSDFIITKITSSTIALSWNEVTGATGYDIEIDGKVFDNTLNTSYIHTALKPNEEHTYRARAKNGATVGKWTQEIKKATLLPAPINLKATAAGDQIKLEWDLVIGAESYEVEIDGKVLKAGSNPEYTQKGLTASLTHRYRVRAINSNDSGDWSTEITKTALLGIPANITATSQSNSITISWSAVDGAFAYDVMVDGKIIDNINSTSYEYKGLLPNSMHVFMVRARNSDYIGEWSKQGEWSTAQAAFTMVGTPSNVKTTAKSTEIAVTWDEVDGADSYDISVDGKIISNGAATVYKHTKLTPNSQHSYKVRARNKNGEGEWSALVTQITGPAVPKNLKADAKINQIALTWDKSEGAVSYEVEVDGEIIKNILIGSYLSQGLEPNTRHEYRVRALSKEGIYSEWSELLEVNTTEELIINVDKDTEFNFVIAVPRKEATNGYDIVVNYNPEDVEVIDLFANTQTLDLKTGKIDGTSISVKAFAEGKIVYHVEYVDKSVITIIRFTSKTNELTKMSYMVE